MLCQWDTLNPREVTFSARLPAALFLSLECDEPDEGLPVLTSPRKLAGLAQVCPSHCMPIRAEGGQMSLPLLFFLFLLPSNVDGFKELYLIPL